LRQCRSTAPVTHVAFVRTLARTRRRQRTARRGAAPAQSSTPPRGRGGGLRPALACARIAPTAETFERSRALAAELDGRQIAIAVPAVVTLQARSRGRARGRPRCPLGSAGPPIKGEIERKARACARASVCARGQRSRRDRRKIVVGYECRVPCVGGDRWRPSSCDCATGPTWVVVRSMATVTVRSMAELHPRGSSCDRWRPLPTWVVARSVATVTDVGRRAIDGGRYPRGSSRERSRCADG
jgi:hypothetical protein